MQRSPRTISVVTPVHPPSIPFLTDAYASLRDQRLPAGWQWRWLVQEDGQTGAVAAALPDDPRISTGTNRPGGPGVTRTMALSRADGSLVKVLDADDRLTPDALARDIAVLAADPTIGWTTARALDLAPDGSTSAVATDPAPGRLPAGAVHRHWQANAHQLPVHPATLCIRTELLFALGGWMALPASEDTGLLLAASTVSDGHFIGEAGLHYRKWPGQVTSQQTHWSPAERANRTQVIESRVAALRRLRPVQVDGPSYCSGLSSPRTGVNGSKASSRTT
ncbi:glycosyltransferase [Micromonospora sp. NBC_01813]|uniref:glycosyltransferase n=1 Tax=Micromonospora sp. NBC_01813 TaxID=2975988 RepID=UPI002DDBFF90|nr:glycosyltransferase [Micromonospora sp. NBC_01813]WSA07439.1 glycosyltransferase [Micromonospora sp. NBC_01813]